jgi:threonyl-tRNA synthetase
MNNEKLYAMRHSLAHILAAAVQRLWPEARFGIGPVVENGFYYDIDIPNVTISTDDFKQIEKEMRKLIAQNQIFERTERPIDEAIKWAQDSRQPFKEELLNDLKRSGTTVAKDLDSNELGTIADGDGAVESVNFYQNGDFSDLCRGPHVENTSEIGVFKLMRVAGAYWRGNEKNPQMQRLYGVAFLTEEELNQHLTILEEAKKRDHRKLGQELDLFVFSDLVGAGLPLWTPRGTVLKNELDRFVQDLREQAGFEQVSIPHITKKDLYEKSGHWSKFKDELFRIITRDGHEFAMKPMNCPHHIQIYTSKPRSYRELPIRYRDTTMVYRDEQSGELGGLSRVRAITQDDAHIFCRTLQVEEEANNLWDIIETFYKGTGFTELTYRLSTHDETDMERYSGDIEQWRSTVAQLENILKKRVSDNYFIGMGEAAFYGPKIDFMARDAIGREHQVATIQIDFNQPEGFDVSCTNEQGEAERIIMLHCAVMGSHERFLSVYIEHTAGRFPIWCAPEQLRIIQVNDSTPVQEFIKKLCQNAREKKVRFTIDSGNDSVGKKIRNAELMKVPYTIVVGDKEVESGYVSPRIRTDLVVHADEQHHYEPEQLIASISNEAKGRASRSSL